MKPTHCSLALLFLGTIGASAEVRLPKIFTDDMMLQRDRPVHVWGWADPSEDITATLSGQKASTKTTPEGTWSLELPALKEGENLELSVSGKNSITLKNIIIGDLWVCGGQSNMEWALQSCLGAAEDIAAADLPKIRRIRINKVQSGRPGDDAPIAGPWQVCAPGTAGGFTAAGFYFAREILQQTGVPIGLIDSNWGGTRIEPWTNTAGMAMVPELKAPLDAFNAEMAKRPAPATPQEPVKEGPWSGMYNAMIHPFTPLPIKGAIWYQGESNGAEGESYYDKKRALVGGWRSAWGQGDFPFYWVQLASYQAPNADPAGGNGWAKLREAQTKALDIPHTGMAVILDTVPLEVANDIHPKNKYDVGYRLARWALAKDYGKTELVPSGPLFKALTIEGNKARLSFHHTGAGLMIGKKSGRDPVAEDKEGKLQRFAIAGADRKWHWADAVIENDTVLVSSSEVPAPLAVRYAYEMNPNGANLYNRDGLPAGPFRTDDW